MFQFLFLVWSDLFRKEYIVSFFTRKGHLKYEVLYIMASSKSLHINTQDILQVRRELQETTKSMDLHYI